MPIKIEHIDALNSVNFYVPQALTKAPDFIAVTSQNLPQNILARQLLDIEGIKRCLIADNLIGIQYAPFAARDDVVALVLAEIDDYMAVAPEAATGESNLSPLQQIETLADSFIRPTLMRDNGNIRIISITLDTVQIQFTGHCAGCPYAQNTLNNVIAAALKKYLPQIQTVQMVEA